MSIGTTVSTNISPDVSYTILKSGTSLCNITLTRGVWMIHGSITWPADGEFDEDPIFTGIYKDAFISPSSICDSTIFLNVQPYTQNLNQNLPRYPSHQTLSLIDKVVDSTTYYLNACSPNNIGNLTSYANNIYPMDLYATRIA